MLPVSQSEMSCTASFLDGIGLSQRNGGQNTFFLKGIRVAIGEPVYPHKTKNRLTHSSDFF